MPLWKPRHMQPLYAGCEVYGGAVGAELFRSGLCLPSGSAMTEGEQGRVVEGVRGVHRGGVGRA
jgi:pyridoxal phosphate-dependent aminotransferase EpsN